MTKAEIDARVEELEKMQDEANNKAEENAKMVVDILNKFYYKSGDYTHKMYIEKGKSGTYLFRWYFEPESCYEAERKTKEAIKYATELGIFDELVEYMLNVAIPVFIKQGENVPLFRHMEKTAVENTANKFDPLNELMIRMLRDSGVIDD